MIVGGGLAGLSVVLYLFDAIGFLDPSQSAYYITILEMEDYLFSYR